jgi:outer membrane protein insertion porin family
VEISEAAAEIYPIPEIVRDYNRPMSIRSYTHVPGCLLIVLVSGCGLIKITERPPTGLEAEQDYGRRITEIRVHGLQYTRERVVYEQMYSRVGQVYTEETAHVDYRYLNRLEVFSSIRLDAVPDSSQTGLILNVYVTEINPYTPSIKIGITDENGLNFGLGGSSANLFGSALKANASFNFGGQSGIRGGLASPWRPGRLVTFNGQASWQIRDNKADDFRENAVEIETQLMRNIGRSWRLGAAFDFVSMGSDKPDITLSPDNRDNLARLGAFVGYDTRDSPGDPKNGLFAFIDLGRAMGDAHYWRGNLDLRGYWTPFDRHTLAVFSFNTRTSGQTGVQIPEWDNFEIGGTNTVRGWTFGARVGKNQYIATFEYRYMLVKPKLVQLWFLKMNMGLQLALFGDAGTAFDTDTRPKDNLISGAGIGLRLIVPGIDMIRFDFAAGQPSVGITVHIGSSSKATAQRNRVR